MKLRVYISGQITNLTHEEYHHNFNSAETILTNNGYEVVNPLKVQACVDEKCNRSGETKPDGSYLHAYSCYMKHDIMEMLTCHIIAMLPNWRNSRGAMIELGVASACGLEVFYFDPLTPGRFVT